MRHKLVLTSGDVRDARAVLVAAGWGAARRTVARCCLDVKAAPGALSGAVDDGALPGTGGFHLGVRPVPM